MSVAFVYIDIAFALLTAGAESTWSPPLPHVLMDMLNALDASSEFVVQQSGRIHDSQEKARFVASDGATGQLPPLSRMTAVCRDR